MGEKKEKDEHKEVEPLGCISEFTINLYLRILNIIHQVFRLSSI